ncbi:TPA: hypothetical protein N0F65_004179 [Lagenidium giganteum]|uniref:Uncharacterized protein n=1 Tax=Lagenidium giganteum TaxID=4803 RepID=A0AAV2YL70_9STRA|nr:TPA: hypothetical protein N0F65_004179 [Lagenidium giganteum]
MPRRPRTVAELLARIPVPFPLFLLLTIGIVAYGVGTPIKEFALGHYMTKPFDEVRDEAVARKVNHVLVATSGVHYFDTFQRPETLPLFHASAPHDLLSRNDSQGMTLMEFLVEATVSRQALRRTLPPSLLAAKINIMDDLNAPLCSPTPTTRARLLFGNYFPDIDHDFCRHYGAVFPIDRFFRDIPTASHLNVTNSNASGVTLGLIAVVNMSEVYLRHFEDPLVIRKIMKNVLEGFTGATLPAYTDAAADAIVARYARGIVLDELLDLLPEAFPGHVRLVDFVALQPVLDFFTAPQKLTMGVNINGEPAVLAEVTHATAAFLTTDHIVNTMGTHLISTMHLAPFWHCAIAHTTMDKQIRVQDVDAAAIAQCGRDDSALLPMFIVNLIYLFQKSTRDYGKMDNATVYTAGRVRSMQRLPVPEKLDESVVLSIDGSGWPKPTGSQPMTPYGYLYTKDCEGLVHTVMTQGGRNVQKYQAYIGDGLGDCRFRDSQETPPQTLCRLVLEENELLFVDLENRSVAIPACADFGSSEAHDLRQVEWFMIETKTLDRRLRVQDNTSRQIRTLFLILNLIATCAYGVEYLRVFKSTWLFLYRSVYAVGCDDRSTSSFLLLRELIDCDPVLGVLRRQEILVLIYLGAIGSLSNLFSSACMAELATNRVVIHCNPLNQLNSAWLCFTGLNAADWILMITRQIAIARRGVDYTLRLSFPRMTAMYVGALLLHFGCKAVADAMVTRTVIESDPHLYAIAGGWIMALLVSFVFCVCGGLFWEWISPPKSTPGPVLKRAPSRLHRSTRLSSKTACGIASVLESCATQDLAAVLEQYCRCAHDSALGKLEIRIEDYVKQSNAAPTADVAELFARIPVPFPLFLLLTIGIVAYGVGTPIKEFALGHYMTKPFDEVRDEAVARKVNHVLVATSGVHYFDTFQ